MNTKKFLLPLFVCLAFCESRAQDKTTFGLQYQYAVPTGAFRSNFVRDGSGRGLGADLLQMVHPKWRIGAAFGYQDFYQKTPRSLYSLEDGSELSAVRTNSVQVTTLMAKGLYLPLPEKRLQPYLSIAAGANMAQVRQLFGMFDNINDTHFGFAAQLGAGLKFGLGASRRTHLSAGMLYNHLPFDHHGIGNLNHLAFGIGARFTLRQNNNWQDDDEDRNGGRRRPRHYERW